MWGDHGGQVNWCIAHSLAQDVYFGSSHCWKERKEVHVTVTLLVGMMPPFQVILNKSMHIASFVLFRHWQPKPKISLLDSSDQGKHLRLCIWSSEGLIHSVFSGQVCFLNPVKTFIQNLNLGCCLLVISQAGNSNELFLQSRGKPRSPCPEMVLMRLSLIKQFHGFCSCTLRLIPSSWNFLDWLTFSCYV